jgi:endonuclease G
MTQSFLDEGICIEMPRVGLEYQEDVLWREELRDGFIADYIHYSLVMSEFNNQAYFSAANLDQSQFRSVKGRRWFVDGRIGKENQVGNEAYSKNDWDRGHLTRRTAVTWGSERVAKKASNDSCSYANASMQHANYNQDEWRVPEKVVQYLERDKNGRINIFTGPIYTNTDRWYTRRSLREYVRIPSGFWKVISYIGKTTGKLECQAYVVYQDAEALKDKKGEERMKPGACQVTITEVERLTGLEFDEALFNANALYYYPRDGINRGPEGFAAPRTTDPGDLDAGVVFTREDAESEAFISRKRDISDTEFDEYIDLAIDV